MSFLKSCYCLLLLFSCVVYAIPYHGDAPVLDGKLTDACWQLLPWRSGFTQLGTSRLAKAQTKFKVCHDGKSIYLAIHCEEPNLPKLVTSYPQDDLVFWKNDTVEINLVTDPNIMSIHKMIIDSRGRHIDYLAEDDNTNRGTFILTNGWHSGARICTSRDASGWSVELSLPLGSLFFSSAQANHWRLNIGRNRWCVVPEELSSWSRLPYRSHLIPKAFNTVSIKKFDARKYDVAIANTKGRVCRQQKRLIYKVSADIHNDSPDYRKLHVHCTLVNLGTGQTNSQRKTVSLSSHTFASVEMSLPFDANGKHALHWELYSNNRIPVLLKRTSREVSISYVPLSLELVRPSYRGNLYATMPDKTIEVLIKTEELQNQHVRVSLVGSGVHETQSVRLSSSRARVVFDGSRLPDGTYELRATGGSASQPLEQTARLRKLPYRRGEVWLDGRGVTHVDGKPFLPYGWYGSHGKREDIYNSFVLPSPLPSTQMVIQRLQTHYETYGLKSLIFPFMDGTWEWKVFKNPDSRMRGLTAEQRRKIIDFVTTVSRQEGLLGWYMADEPENGSNPVWYEEAYDLIRDIDPYHPCFMLNWGPYGIRKYHRACDVLFPDCYPQFFDDGSTAKPRWMPSDYAKLTTSLKPAAWQMPLMTCWPDKSIDGKRGIPPNFLEQRSQIFQPFIHDVKGINMYAWHDSQRYSALILGPPAIGRTLLALKDYLLEDSVPEGIKVTTTPSDQHFQVGLKQHGKQFCVLAVNTSTRPLRVTFQLGNGFTGLLYTEGAVKSLTCKQGTFTDDLGPVESRIYLTDKSLAETLIAPEVTIARIKRHQADRKKTGNLIGRGEMLPLEYQEFSRGNVPPGVPVITASSDLTFYITKKTGSLYYLIDGLTEPVRPEYTWRHHYSDRKPWVNLSFRKPLRISSVKLYTPNGNLHSGAIIMNGQRYFFRNPQKKNEITIRLKGEETDHLRLEIEKHNQTNRFGGTVLDERMLSEVEVYGTSCDGNNVDAD